MSRSVLACALSALTIAAAPAVAGAQTEAERTAGTGVLGRAYVIENSAGPNGLYVTELAATPAMTFQALQAVYSTLKIPMTGVDPNQLTLGTTAWQTPHWLAGHELSRYFDCGSGRGQSADEMAVRMTIQSRVKPDSTAPDRSVLTTSILQISAMDQVEGMRSRPCQSTGELETRISDEVAKRVK